MVAMAVAMATIQTRILNGPMPEKYTDPTEKAAWEIFVQLVGRGKDVDTAVPDAFDAVERFDRYCDERRKETAPAKRNRSDPPLLMQAIPFE